MISILVPSKGRPAYCKRMLESVGHTVECDGRVMLALDRRDTDLYQEYVPCDLIVPDGLPTVHKWNLLAKKAMEYSSHNLFMLGADDIIFSTSGWDKAIIDHYNALENKIHVYSLCDSRDPSGTPHPIVTREYIEAMGYFLPPIFLHWYVDTWTVEIAKANDCFTHMKDYLLVHDKPSDSGQSDETHNGIRRMGWHERDKYVNDTCQHFLEYEKLRLGEKL